MPKIVYGIFCTWYGAPEQAGRIDTVHRTSLSCCPHCESLLLEMNEDDWKAHIDLKASQQRTPNDYIAMLKWARGKCFFTWRHLKNAWEIKVSSSFEFRNDNPFEPLSKWRLFKNGVEVCPVPSMNTETANALNELFDRAALCRCTTKIQTPKPPPIPITRGKKRKL